MSILDAKTTDTDKSVQLEDTKDHQGADEVNIAAQMSGLVLDKFNYARTCRLLYEEMWMRFWRNFRGIYGPMVKYTDTEKSQVFVKITKTKAIAAFGQILDVVLSNGDFPIGIEPTPKPVGVADIVSISQGGQPGQDEPAPQDDAPQPASRYGFHGDGNDLPPGATHDSLLPQDLDNKVQEAGLSVKPGPAQDQFSIEIHPAEMAAKKMEKTIKDQLEETDGIVHLSNGLYEMVILGTGCIKGPFTKSKTYNRWLQTESGFDYSPEERDVPCIEAVSIWDIYPDPEARYTNECAYIIQRHGKTDFQLRELKQHPGFRANVIDYLLDNFRPDYQPYWFEAELKDFTLRPMTNRYQVLEFWGYVDKKLAEQFNIDIPEFFKDQDQVFVNVWICCNQVIRLVFNPFTPVRMPYLLVPYERNPYTIWGVGVPENMEDSQMIMNGHARMAIDNLALAGNVVFEVDETYMTNTEDMRIYPGRVFRRQGGPPGQSIFALNFKSTTQENMLMFDKFRELADESTNIPSISHGQTGITGTTRTSSGMSMIMNASTIAIKTVIRNLDIFLFKPLGESFFSWNMQFNPDVEIRGDLEIKARGTSSLMQKEVRSQRIMMLMQVGANPNFAPFIKWSYLLTELAKDLDLDADKVVNDINEAKLQALLIRAHNNTVGQGPGGGGQPGQDSIPGPGDQSGVQGSAGSVSTKDTKGTGNGTIGAANPVQPGEPGFSQAT